MNVLERISQELGIESWKIEKAVELLDQGSTVPFIARYRKEVTGSLTDTELRTITERLSYLRNLEERKKTVLEQIESLGKLTDDLKEKIESCLTLSALEDLYRPYKPKRETRGSKAIKKGLKPLAEFIQDGKNPDLDEEAKKYISEEKDVKSAQEAIAGALDIIAEEISDNPNYRTFIKKLAYKNGKVVAKKIEGCEITTYDTYANYSEKISTIKPHRVLAISRATKEKVLNKSIELPTETILGHISSFEINSKNNYKEMLRDTIKDSYERLIYPSVSNDIFSDLFEKAEDSSIVTFKSNLKNLLLEPPLKDKVVMGFDPGFRTGCKVAIVDKVGQVLATDVLHATLGGKGVEIAHTKCVSLLKKYKVDVIALGNGTASRESGAFLTEVLKEVPGCKYLVVSEAGASVYSASKAGEKEFPDFDVSLRSAVSIARRLQDPLAELVKINPMSIGVGQYQHDMNPKKLKDALVGVIEDVVNLVGVDLNSASPALLSYISGISSTIANNIVEYRYTNGHFKNRQDLLKVKGFGPKAFENAAGFLRVEGDEPLDNTSIHPESYDIARSVLKHYNSTSIEDFRNKLSDVSEEEIKKEAVKMGVGEITLTDIVKNLLKPYRDPRDQNKEAHLNNSVTKIEDLKEGMTLEGTIRNVMDFGCFVDIGVHSDGLVHISELSKDYVSDINKIVKVGQIVKVVVISVDLKRNRIGLSIKQVEEKGE